MIKPADDKQAFQYICNKGPEYRHLSDVRQLGSRFKADFPGLPEVTARYPFRISPYFLSLIQQPDDPLGRQVIPDEKELHSRLCAIDPLSEEDQSPVAHLIHRYPDRALFLVSDQCAMYCRYCMRRRMVGRSQGISRQSIHDGIAYIRKNKSIREVLLSGGDPFMLTNRTLDHILFKLREISHVEVLRIHTRTPGALPHRITEKLAEMLKKYHPLFINIQFNHPAEITDTSTAACTLLADAGIPLGSQTVLLKGINDDPEILKNLFTQLLKIRVKPYYLHHPDVVKGTDHFRIPISKGLKIFKSLQGHISGMAIPRYMIDLPGGGGKIPLLPEFITAHKNGILKVESFDGKIYEYPKD